MSYKVINELERRLRKNLKTAMVIITEKTGSSPGVEGSMMLVYPDGETFGTVGGGTLEFNIIQSVLQKMELSENFRFEYDLSESGDISMICGGKTSGYVKYYNNRKPLVIFGAGHVGRALVKVVSELGFEITLVDERKEYLEDPMFENINTIHSSFEELSDEIQLDGAYIIIMTPSHSFDYEVLRAVVGSDFEYLGMLGSQKKVKTIKDRLISEGVSREKVERLYMPVGLNVATGSPEEIAISVAAELLAVKNSVDHVAHLSENKN